MVEWEGILQQCEILEALRNPKEAKPVREMGRLTAGCKERNNNRESPFLFLNVLKKDWPLYKQ